ncbi:hypothetical protein ACFY8K_18245 [Streptomyces misionensis]|uniref:hypothetical protein n=1 Tax=Streptomyces misionensis TaxID=67331 RepID=UPI0036D1A049
MTTGTASRGGQERAVPTDGATTTAWTATAGRAHIETGSAEALSTGALGTRAAAAEAAASGLGAGTVRRTRLSTAWTGRSGLEHGAADRVLLARPADPGRRRRGSPLGLAEAGHAAYRSAVRRREAEPRPPEPWPAEDRCRLTRLPKRLDDDLVDSTYTSLGAGPHPAGEARQGDPHA